MGCDIHIITEIKKDGKWQYIPEIPEEFDHRNYGLFALFADVRNSFGTKGFKPKGLPADISAKKFNFESYMETGKRRYSNPDDMTMAFIAKDGSIQKSSVVPYVYITEEQYNQLCQLQKDDNDAYSRQYASLGWSQSYNEGKKWYVCDAYAHGGHFEKVMWNALYPTLEEFMAYMYEDEFDEERGEYGRWHIDFDCEDLHTPSYLTLEELVNGDYKDYFANKYKMDKGFYDDFIAMGGKFPEGMEVVEHEPSEFADIIRCAFSPIVMIVWDKTDADKENSDLYKGIESMKKIAEKYGITNNSDIRIVFAFDN